MKKIFISILVSIIMLSCFIVPTFALSSTDEVLNYDVNNTTFEVYLNEGEGCVITFLSGIIEKTEYTKNLMFNIYKYDGNTYKYYTGIGGESSFDRLTHGKTYEFVVTESAKYKFHHRYQYNTYTYCRHTYKC